MNAYRIVTLLLALSIRLTVFSQTDSTVRNSDTTRTRTGRWIHNIFLQARSSVSRGEAEQLDAHPESAILNTPAETPYLPYHGKIIRYIFVDRLGFDRSFIDTSKRITNFASRAAAALHVNTKEWVVRNHLFIRERTPLNAYLVADNERYLRTLNFMQDCRIIVKTIRNKPDSVDLVVFTKDLFTIRVVADIVDPTRGKVRIEENNFLGMGQQLRGTVVMDTRRGPNTGWGAQYTRSSMAGSFINVVGGYSNMDNGRSLGGEEEEAGYIILTKPLASPFMRTAGGLEISVNEAHNRYHKPESLYYDYAYRYMDVWAGHNVGVGRLLQHDTTLRDRKFVALRYVNADFLRTPAQIGEQFNWIYNSRQAVLAQITLFRQEFVKTQYIYGFGVTEDVPYGYNVSLTAGWWRQLNLDRPYLGLEFEYFFIRPTGSFYQPFLRLGGFGEKHILSDVVLLAGLNTFSRILPLGRTRVRAHAKASYTQLTNRKTLEPLRIDNNAFGLRYYNRDSAIGARRTSLQTETMFYLPGNLAGFRLAPFFYADVVMLLADRAPIQKAGFYPGFGGGLRTRNPSLIFGTIEVRGIYLPPTPYSKPQYRLDIASDIRFRYNRQYVHQPDIVRYNYDEF